jgi:hypothetical protein
VPGGRLLLMEHVLSSRPVLRRIVRLVKPLVVRVAGANAVVMGASALRLPCIELSREDIALPFSVARWQAL